MTVDPGAIVATVLALLAGVLLGWVLRARAAAQNDGAPTPQPPTVAAPPATDPASPPPRAPDAVLPPSTPPVIQERAIQERPINLWDAHACLNALNRCAFDRANDGVEGDPIFLVAAHLQMLGALTKADGWARRAQIDQWLVSLMDLHQFLHPAKPEPKFKISLPHELQRIQLAPLGALLVSMLRLSGPLRSITITTVAPVPAGAQSVQLEVRMKGGAAADPDAAAAQGAAPLSDLSDTAVCAAVLGADPSPAGRRAG